MLDILILLIALLTAILIIRYKALSNISLSRNTKRLIQVIIGLLMLLSGTILLYDDSSVHVSDALANLLFGVLLIMSGVILLIYVGFISKKSIK